MQPDANPARQGDTAARRQQPRSAAACVPWGRSRWLANRSALRVLPVASSPASGASHASCARLGSTVRLLPPVRLRAPLARSVIFRWAVVVGPAPAALRGDMATERRSVRAARGRAPRGSTPRRVHSGALGAHAGTLPARAAALSVCRALAGALPRTCTLAARSARCARRVDFRGCAPPGAPRARLASMRPRRDRTSAPTAPAGNSPLPCTAELRSARCAPRARRVIRAARCAHRTSAHH